MKFQKIIAAAAMLSLPASAVAQSQCLTTTEAETVVQALMPSIVEDMHRTCSSYLPEPSALRTRGLDLAARYAPTAMDARPEAAAIAMRIFEADTEDENPEEISEYTVLSILEFGASAYLSGAMNERSCPTVDGFFSALEPLPAENMAGLLVLLMEIGGRQPDNGSPFQICPRSS